MADSGHIGFLDLCELQELPKNCQFGSEREEEERKKKKKKILLQGWCKNRLWGCKLDIIKR